jgi:CheY-like chemotaxis protein
MSETQTLTAAARTPTVYFIDDSATMREVIKIAFRKENIQVITCADAASAMAQFGLTAPDAVITDVIMPDQDGYQVCEFIKQHDRFGATPVILMSGVVNRSVAEKAMAVKADELIRKPFQPHDLIARVKNLLNPKSDRCSGGDRSGADASEVLGDGRSSSALSSLFSAGAAPSASGPATPPVARRELSPAVAARSTGPEPVAPRAAPDVQRLRHEILRLELLVKKLQTELEAEHQYCAALEAHFKNLQETL